MDPNFEFKVRRWRKRRKACVVTVLLIMEMYMRRFPDRRVWIHHYIGRRAEQGAHNNLFLELRTENPDKYKRCLRMTPQMFDWLTEKVRPLIQKQDTHMRRSIPVDERLSVTLRHLATGETQESLSLLYRIGQSTISGIIKETCVAIYDVLKGTYLKFPSTAEEWTVVANDYGTRWNFHNCIGAMDGKHVLIEPPIQSGSLYYNYKDTFSIVLLAVVDAQLRFIYVDVGTNGRISDKGVWNKSSLRKKLDENSVKIPPPSPLPGINRPFPFIIVGDEGFTLTDSVLIPYPKEQLRNRHDRSIFNYRLSRARRCSENAFGVMSNRFQIFRAPLRYDPDSAKDIVNAVLCLHNLLRSDVEGRLMYTPPTILDREDEMTGHLVRGEWRDAPATGLQPIGQGGNRHGVNALILREQWTEYFNGVGAVPWQDRMVRVN